MIELVRDLRVMNMLAKFENDPWKIMDVRVLTGLVWPAARPLEVRQYPGARKGCGVKKQSIQNVLVIMVYNSIKYFNEYMSVDYNSIGHIEIKVFGIQSTDTHSLIWILSYTYIISFTQITWHGCIYVI